METMLIALTLIAFALSCLLTPLCGAALRRLGVVDHPDECRKLHNGVIPRAGGVSLLISYTVALGAFCYALPTEQFTQERMGLIWNAAASLGLVFVTGLVDDLRGLRPTHKLLGQSIAAVLVWWSGLRIVLPWTEETSWLSLLATVGWLVLCMNAVNLLDGVDGLVTALAICGAVTMAVAGLLESNTLLLVASLPLAAALLGFLRWNLPPASIFLGDSGSLTIGFLLGCLGIVWQRELTSPVGFVAPFMVLFVPILDAIASLVRRFLRRKPVFEGDRGHIHHRLLDRGLSSGQTVLMLSGVSSVGAVLSLAATAPYPPLYRAALVAFCGFLALVVWVAIHRFGYVEIAFALRMLARGQFNRRLLEAELCLHELERTLDREQSVEACWCAIQRISDLLGFQGVTLRLRGFVYGSQGECREDECCWKLCISLPEDTGIDLFQRFVMPGASIIPISVVGPLRDLLSRKVHALMSSPYPHHGEEELQARRAAAL